MSELIFSTSDLPKGNGGLNKESSKTSRRILCVSPGHPSSFYSYEYLYPLLDGIKAHQPPLGLLVIAAYLPKTWQVRLVDKNIRDVSDDDFKWAEAVFVSGMHLQRQQINDICRRAHDFNLPVALGGPSVSACPEYYPDLDYLHIGELGDATDELIRLLANDTARPSRQIVLTTRNRVAMSDFPVPAYDLVEAGKYLAATLQYSSGCPYECEFCDIPALYGRNPRLKTPQQILTELDRVREYKISDSVYFVDDNFIGNRKATSELLPHLIEWQKNMAIQLNSPAKRRLISPSAPIFYR